MPNAPALEALLALHRIDSRIDKLEKQKKLLPASLRRIRERLDRQQELLAAKREAVKKLRADTHSKEVLLRAAEEEAEAYKVKLNTASSNKEYTALQHEITDKRVEASKIEDQVLAAMADVDALQAAIKQIDEAVAQIQHEYDQESGKADRAAGALDQQLEGLQGERRTACEAVDPALLEEYQRIAAKKGASALALVTGEVCQGCFMQLPPQLAHTVVAGTTIVHCPSCSRILYAP
ncbi:MAG: hypothetical protein ISS72_02595 [Candidatus Brocadiae bacterium]|nr:hypothetical protein [Candidatus Brocadiia bacterium]